MELSGELFYLIWAISYTVGFRQSRTAHIHWTFFDLILLVVLFLIVSRVYFKVIVLFLEAVCVTEYCCTAVENRLAALCFARSTRATPAWLATNLSPSGLVALRLDEIR